MCAIDERHSCAFRSDKRLNARLGELDKLYAALSAVLDELVDAVGLKAAKTVAQISHSLISVVFGGWDRAIGCLRYIVIALGRRYQRNLA